MARANASSSVFTSSRSVVVIGIGGIKAQLTERPFSDPPPLQAVREFGPPTLPPAALRIQRGQPVCQGMLGPNRMFGPTREQLALQNAGEQSSASAAP